MKEYVDEMLRLASDIVEGLLTVKDNDSDIDPELNLLIQQLAVISDKHTFVGVSAEPVSEAEVAVGNLPDADCAESDAGEIVEDVMSDALDEAATPEDERSEESVSENVEAEEVAEAVLSADEGQADMSEQVIPEAETEPELEQAVSESAMEEQADEADVTAVGESEKEQEPETDPEPEPEPVPEVIAESEPESEADVAVLPCCEEPETPSISDNAAEHAVPSVSYAELRRAFSLNDIFLYQRTLFGGSADRFNEALHAVSMMTSASELRRYLADVQQVNLKSEPAKEFIAVLMTFLED